MADARSVTPGRSAVSRFEELSEVELETLHEVELGIERIHRAHGHLVAFHHNTGRGMNHLAAAENLLRSCDNHRLADSLREEYLPRGVVAACNSGDPTAGRWSYDILESFQDVFLNDIVAFGDEVRTNIANGLRHAFERQQEQAWKDGSEGD